MSGGPRSRHGAGARTVVRASLTVLCAVAASARSSRAQDNPALRTAVQLAAEGRGDSARRIVDAEIAKARPGEPAYVEALYWRGRLALSGDSAERDLRRVAIEYSTSPWADQALLQLAQLAQAAGNSAAALQLAGRLRSDYPTSALRARAALWGGRAAFEVGDPATACALLDSARAESPGDVEFLNQVAFYRGRCAAIATTPRADTSSPPGGRGAPPDTARAAARPDSTSTARPVARFDVQVTATKSSRTAQTLLDRLTKAGQPGHVVKGSDGLLRVRVGPFATEAEASAAATRLRRSVGGHPFVIPAS
ncbi:MAG TPA: SPOR domain-containing protein [Gemmatimonadales bacterium]|nr:SPOR domain-containing protein [Gemmatimonadales bacterium]